MDTEILPYAIAGLLAIFSIGVAIHDSWTKEGK